jgi:ligand-binding SRPBCC domain-containing protein
MKEFQLRRTQRFEESLDEVFGFFADPRNLSLLTPPWLRFEIRTPEPIAMHEGARIDYRLRLHGFPLSWQSEISTWEPPHRFVDEQRAGPYRHWVHEHRFREVDALTEVSDDIRFSVLGGSWVYRLFVAGDLEKIFAYRRQILAGVFTEAPAS